MTLSNPRTLMYVAAVILVGLGAASCSGDKVTENEVSSAQELWSSNRPAAYHWRSDGFIGRVNVDIDLIIDGADVEPLDGIALSGDYSAGGLLDQIQDALAGGAGVEARFDSDLGYPTRVKIGAYGDRPAIDLTTRDFIPIEQPDGCVAEVGSPTDLSAEPVGWLLYGDYIRWQDPQGCDVRVDVISHIFGPAHCGWESIERLSIGSPIGVSINSGEGRAVGTRTFIWDPQGVLEDIDDQERNVSLVIDDLPATAIDTGFRLGENELWLDGNDPHALYRVADGAAQRFVLDTDNVILCG